MANYSVERIRRSGAKGNTLARRVYKVLRDDIQAGRIKPGERLVRKTVAERLGVSTLPVIEALYMLEIDGYVENLPLLGCCVQSLTMEGIENDLMLREALECQVARLVVENASDDGLSKLLIKSRQVDRFVCDNTPDPILGSQLHWEFHSELGRLCGYSVFSKKLTKVWFQRYMRFNSFKSYRFEPPPPAWHENLVMTLIQRDPDQAEKAMREHVRFGRKDDRKALELYLQSLEE